MDSERLSKRNRELKKCMFKLFIYHITMRLIGSIVVLMMITMLILFQSCTDYDSFEKQIKLGDDHLNNGKVSDASVAYDSALIIGKKGLPGLDDNRLFNLHLRLGLVEFAKSDTEKAKHYFSSVIKNHPLEPYPPNLPSWGKKPFVTEQLRFVKQKEGRPWTAYLFQLHARECMRNLRSQRLPKIAPVLNISDRTKFNTPILIDPHKKIDYFYYAPAEFRLSRSLDSIVVNVLYSSSATSSLDINAPEYHYEFQTRFGLYAGARIFVENKTPDTLLVVIYPFGKGDYLLLLPYTNGPITTSHIGKHTKDINGVMDSGPYNIEIALFKCSGDCFNKQCDSVLSYQKFNDFFYLNITDTSGYAIDYIYSINGTNDYYIKSLTYR
jgi:hypothetical protein